MMNWPQLLNWNRLKEDRVGPLNASRPPWQVDHDRIVFSSAFRRLQDKTQVFPLSGSDYVRTRLTHSIEVAAVARTLGTMAGVSILEKHGAEPVERPAEKTRSLEDLIDPGDIGAIVAAAAMAHDLGNPPFGHSGEDAVRHWFETSKYIAKARLRLPHEHFEDLKEWEGNAQGFRILTRLQLYGYQEGGMRLTYATLAAFCKYPTFSTDICHDSRKAKADVSRKKFGIFRSEQDLFTEVAEATGLLRHPTRATAWCRHPLAFLVEAADDICYRVIDLEDAVRLNRIPYNDAEELLLAIDPKAKKRQLERDSSPQLRISHLRAIAIRRLVDEVIEAFKEFEPKMLRGRFNESLSEKIPAASVLDAIRDLMKKHVYITQSVLEVEAAGFQIIPGLLDLYWSAVSAGKAQRHSRRALKVRQLIPSDFQGPRGKDPRKTYERMLRIADYVSGMTDSYALELFRKLNGMSLPGADTTPTAPALTPH